MLNHGLKLIESYLELTPQKSHFTLVPLSGSINTIEKSWVVVQIGGLKRCGVGLSLRLEVTVCGNKYSFP